MAAGLQELEIRRSLCLSFIHTLSEMDDPRAPAALEVYRGQLAEIEKQMAEITGHPPAIVVGLKSAILFGSTKEGD